MKKTRGLGTNPLAATDPLDAIIPKAPAEPPAKAKPPKRERFTTYISSEASETLRDIAWWCRVPLASLVESAVRREIEAREQANGKPFPRRESELHTGGRVR